MQFSLLYIRHTFWIFGSNLVRIDSSGFCHSFLSAEHFPSSPSRLLREFIAEEGLIQFYPHTHTLAHAVWLFQTARPCRCFQFGDYVLLNNLNTPMRLFLTLTFGYFVFIMNVKTIDLDSNIVKFGLKFGVLLLLLLLLLWARRRSEMDRKLNHSKA